VPRYLTVEQLKAYARNELPTEDDEWFDAAIDAAEATLDRECGRYFAVAGDTATTRRYTPESYQLVRIHDAAEVVSVTSAGSLVSAVDYQLEPVNALTIHGETVPYDRVRLLSGAWWIGSGNREEATVSVTARWGWAAIPPRIEQAALIIAKEIITNRDEVKLGLIGFSDVGGVVARTNPIVRETVAHYRRVESFGIA
jgi:hypothetical protein